MNIITTARGTLNESKRYTLTEEDKHALSVVKEIFKKLDHDDFRLSCPLGYTYEISNVIAHIQKHEDEYFSRGKYNEYYIF